MGKKRGFQEKASRAMTKIPSRDGGVRKATGSSSSLSSMHRGRRKREQTKERLSHKRSFIEAELMKLEALSMKKRKTAQEARTSRSVGVALAILPGLASSLPDASVACDSIKVKAGGKRGGGGGTSEQYEEEKEQLNRVQKHDAFVTMGVGALRAHLLNTVPAPTASAPPVVNTPKRPPPSGQVARHVAATANQQGQQPRMTQSLQAKAAERRNHKKAMAEKALRMGASKRRDVQQQTLGGLLGGKQRGRIGEKRPKDLQ